MILNKKEYDAIYEKNIEVVNPMAHFPLGSVPLSYESKKGD